MFQDGNTLKIDRNSELEGKVAIITGSARNIGKRTAIELANAGAAVVINAVSARDLCEDVANEIENGGGWTPWLGRQTAWAGPTEH